jgi:hypothetical protein
MAEPSAIKDPLEVIQALSCLSDDISAFFDAHVEALNDFARAYTVFLAQVAQAHADFTKSGVSSCFAGPFRGAKPTPEWGYPFDMACSLARIDLEAYHAAYKQTISVIIAEIGPELVQLKKLLSTLDKGGSRKKRHHRKTNFLGWFDHGTPIVVGHLEVGIEKSQNAIEQVRHRLEEQFNVSVEGHASPGEPPSFARLKELIELFRDKKRCARTLATAKAI